MNHKVLLPLLLAGASLVAPALADSSTTLYAIDPHASNILNEMQSAYSSLNSISETIVSEESADVPHRLIVHSTLKIMRPGYMSFVSDSASARSGSSLVLTDGSYCYVTAPQYPTRYLKFPVGSDSTALQSAMSEGILSSMTLDLFSDPQTISKLFPDQDLATLQLGHTTKVDGDSANIVEIDDRNGVDITLAIGKKDHLLRRIQVVDPSKPGTFIETYSTVIPNAPLQTSDFVFTPPAHMDAYLAPDFNQDPEPAGGSAQ